jgi:hypothetical protein
VAITINVNGESISYPETGDTNWSDEATDFAVQTASAFGKLGLSSGTTVDLPGTLDVTGATTLDSTLTVAGTTTVNGTANLNGNTNLGNAITDIVAVTAILNVDAGVLYVDPSTNKVGINDTTPSEALDVTGNALISGTLGVTGNSTFTGDVITSIVKASGSGGLTIDSNGGTDVALFGAGGGAGTTLYGGLNGTTGNFADTTDATTSTDGALKTAGGVGIAKKLFVGTDVTVGGVTYLDDGTTANTPVLSFTGDTNTGIGRSAADTIDLITNGNSRFRIESTGQIKAVYESQVGTDYNTQLDNGYLCRAWVNFNGTGTVAIRASGNVSSITDNGTGDYTINFTTAMPDANYSFSGSTRIVVSDLDLSTARTVNLFRITTYNSSFSPADYAVVNICVFR